MRRLFVLSFLVLSATLAVSEAVRTLPSNWVQLAELTPTIRAKNDWFGISIAINGNTVVVGDFDANIEEFGTVDVFAKPASGWSNMTQTATLSSSDNGIGFGTSVAISGDIIVVGAANTSNFHNPASSPGAVYIFVKPAGGWKDMTETAKLTASDGQPGDAFGNSVSISGNTIAVGAFFVNDFSGRVYVFTCTSGGCTQAAELSASDSDGLLDYLGCSVAISGNTVVAGSYGHNNFQGSAYVYVEPSGGWADMTETAELTTFNGKASDDVGFSVAISGGTIVAGAPGAFTSYGAAYVYIEPPTGWASTGNFTAALGAPDAVQGDSFGQSVGINESAKAIAVGGPGANIGQNLEQGAVYAYVQPKSGWKNTRNAYAEATASDGASADLMGSSIGISGTTIVAGAPKSSSPGAAYVFGR
jgi:FG-GAP repeat protein